jgi:hypothetical protein
MRYYSGYMLKGNRKANFEVRAASKANAYRNIKENYPDWKVVVTISYKKR